MVHFGEIGIRPFKQSNKTKISLSFKNNFAELIYISLITQAEIFGQFEVITSRQVATVSRNDMYKIDVGNGSKCNRFRRKFTMLIYLCFNALNYNLISTLVANVGQTYKNIKYQKYYKGY